MLVEANLLSERLSLSSMVDKFVQPYSICRMVEGTQTFVFGKQDFYISERGLRMWTRQNVTDVHDSVRTKRFVINCIIASLWPRTMQRRRNNDGRKNQAFQYFNTFKQLLNANSWSWREFWKKHVFVIWQTRSTSNCFWKEALVIIYNVLIFLIMCSS